MNKAVFLDRDGVLNALVYRPKEGLWDSPYSLEEFQLLPVVAQALKLVRDMGFLAIVVSNQPGVAKAKCSLSFLQELNQKLQSELAQAGAHLDAIYYCLHHPDGIIAPYGTVCSCRKPKPGLLLAAAREHAVALSRSYMVGDRSVDVQAGQNAGCMTILLDNGTADSMGDVRPHWVAASLLEAAERIRKEALNHGDIPGLSRGE